MKKVDTDKVLKWVQSNLDRKRIYKIINQGISDKESDVLMKRVNKDLKLNIDTDDYKSQDWKDLDSAITSSIDKVFAKMDESTILIESYEEFLSESKELLGYKVGDEFYYIPSTVGETTFYKILDITSNTVKLQEYDYVRNGTDKKGKTREMSVVMFTSNVKHKTIAHYERGDLSESVINESSITESKSNFSGQLKLKDKISLDKLNKDFKNWEFSINPMNPHIQPGSTSKYILTYNADNVDDSEVKRVKSEISKLVESVEIISEIFVGKTGMDDAVNRLNNPRKYTLEDIEDAFKAGQKSDNWNEYKKKVLKIK